MSAPTQLNGLVLLHAYLQRLFAYDTVRAVPPTQSPALSTLIERLAEITAHFDRQNGLSEDQRAETLNIVGAVRPEIASRLLSGEKGGDHELAVIAAMFHGDVHLNQGLQTIGQVYDPSIIPDLQAQVPVLEERLGVINSLVAKVGADEELSPVESDAVAGWYAQIDGTMADVDTDLNQIRELINA